MEPLPIKRIIASRAFLFNDENELLVVGKDGIFFHLPGGWCDDGELVIVACCREIEEETGLKVVHEKVIFIEETITDDVFVKNGLLHRLDIFSIVMGGNLVLDESFVDEDDGLIKHRKFISENEWLNSADTVFAPKELRRLSFDQIRALPNCYGRRVGGNGAHLLG